MKGLSILYAFIGGAIVGGATALLFAPQKGQHLRNRIKNLLKNRGIDFSDDDIEELVDQISSEIKG